MTGFSAAYTFDRWLSRMRFTLPSPPGGACGLLLGALAGKVEINGALERNAVREQERRAPARLAEVDALFRDRHDEITVTQRGDDATDGLADACCHVIL